MEVVLGRFPVNRIRVFGASFRKADFGDTYV